MMVSSKNNFENYTKKCKGLQLLEGKFYTREEILKWAKNEYKVEKKYFLEIQKQPGIESYPHEIKIVSQNLETRKIVRSDELLKFRIKKEDRR